MTGTNGAEPELDFSVTVVVDAVLDVNFIKLFFATSLTKGRNKKECWSLGMYYKILRIRNVLIL